MFSLGLNKFAVLIMKIYHFFLCSSIETPPGPSDTIIKRPPITESVCKRHNKIMSFSVKFFWHKKIWQ